MHTSPSEKVVIIVLVALLGASAYMLFRNPRTTIAPIIPGASSGEVVCTADAKLCPDGSYVQRTGPACEFAACPSGTRSTNDNTRGVLQGVVTLQPTCPVERVPADPACAPKPYATGIEIRRATDGVLISGVTTDASGLFTVVLPVGTYTVRAEGGNPLPRCAEGSATIGKGATTNLSISCDTGIR